MAPRGMSTSDSTADRTFLLSLLHEITMSEGFKGPGQAEMKGPQDFITETDGAVAHVRNALSKRFRKMPPPRRGDRPPGRIEHLGRGSDRRHRQFQARGIPHYCIAIAFVCDNEAELGLIYNPTLDDLFRASRTRLHAQRGADLGRRHDEPDRATVELGWSNRRSNEQYLGAFAALLESGANACTGGAGAGLCRGWPLGRLCGNPHASLGLRRRPAAGEGGWWSDLTS